MSGETSPEFAPELLDDFYSECDEQLGTLRQLIGEFEGGGSKEAPQRLESFFRNMHSLKGNAAIVGLREAEELAHAAEEYLRLLVRGEKRLNERGFSVLGRTVERLEKTINACRHRAKIPSTHDLAAELTELAAGGVCDNDDSAPVSPPAPQPEEVTLHFTPNRDRDARGINVNSVRARLAAQGRIIRCTPLVVEGGAVVFEFVVALDRVLPAEDWTGDGISRVDPPYPPKRVEPQSVHPEASEDALFLTPSHIVRVDMGKLDDLLRIAGELVIHRSRLDDRLSLAGAETRNDLKDVNQALTRSLRELRDAITRVRLVPLAEAFSRLPFAVRELVRNTEKKVRLSVEGKTTEIDKYLVERLKEPLLHLVRNAVSHGLETTREREAAGKPAEGAIYIHAEAVGGFVLIRIRDDGRGIDPQRIEARARRMNLAVPAQWDEKAMLDVICTPGFSTKESVDFASGRGVGLDVVRDVVSELGGRLTLQTSLGTSTQFTLRLPLTLSIVEAIIFSVANQTCAFPQSAVEEIIETSGDAIRSINQTHIIAYRDGVLPVINLAHLFEPERKPGAGSIPVLVVRSDLGLAGLLVDRVIGQREVVVRPLEDPLIRVRGIAGATELGDGRPVLILDAVALSENAVRPHSATPHAPIASRTPAFA